MQFDFESLNPCWIRQSYWTTCSCLTGRFLSQIDHQKLVVWSTHFFNRTSVDVFGLAPGLHPWTYRHVEGCSGIYQIQNESQIVGRSWNSSVVYILDHPWTSVGRYRSTACGKENKPFEHLWTKIESLRFLWPHVLHTYPDLGNSLSFIQRMSASFLQNHTFDNRRQHTKDSRPFCPIIDLNCGCLRDISIEKLAMAVTSATSRFIWAISLLEYRWRWNWYMVEFNQSFTTGCINLYNHIAFGVWYRCLDGRRCSFRVSAQSAFQSCCSILFVLQLTYE